MAVQLFTLRRATVTICLALLLCTSAARAQEITDRTLVTVNSSGRTELITYSDVIWEMALEPGTPLAHPSDEVLQKTLRRLIDLTIIGQEAEKLPTINPTEKEVTDEIRYLVSNFPSRSEFETRLQSVGFRTIDDEQFRKFIERRVAINKYVNFRFYSFVVITSQQVSTYYSQVFAPNYQKANPGAVVPTLEEATPDIEDELRNRQVAADIDAFLENARARADIVYLYQSEKGEK